MGKKETMNTNQASQQTLSYKILFGILVALLALTALTVGASRIDLGKLNIWIALAIASVKSSLVILFFMHMKFEGKAVKIAFLATVCFVAILIGFIFWDIVYR